MNRCRLEILLVAAMLLCVSSVWSAPAVETIQLSDHPDGSPVRVDYAETKSGDVRLVVDVSELEVFAVEHADLLFHDLRLSGAQQAGQTGRPALPAISRLVAVPAGRTLAVAATATDPVSLGKAYRPLPAQGLMTAGEETFDWDRAYYNGDRGVQEPDLVRVGEPALLRGLRVVPVTIHPVSWDPASGELVVARQVTVELKLADSADGLQPRTENLVPESFQQLYETSVLGYEKSRGVDSGPGTYLIIMPNNSSVISAAQPLVEWRQRQGYHVLAATTAETGTTTSSIKSYIQGIYDSVEPPLEFVSLVGDASGSVYLPTYTESLSGYGGEGDHEYTRLEGGDILADIHIGRISVTSASELTTVIGKIVGYESEPDLQYTDWYTTAGLCGDPSSSGNSTIFVSQWVKEQLLDLNYTRIDTIFSGDYLSGMLETLGNGESLFTYRGYWHMSGLDAAFIESLENKDEMPVAVVLTCDTGSFEDDVTAQSEAFLRAPSGGAVASYGTATIGTHTRYNNCMFQGIVEGLLNSGDPRTGPALTMGKLNMYNNYNLSEPTSVAIWSTWNNLMGDPATAMWSAVPSELTVDYPQNIASFANAVPVTVSSGGVPVEGARVALFLDGQVEVSGLTDAAGHLVLPVPGLMTGEILLTVTGRNLYPYLGSVNVGDVTASLVLSAQSLDGDGQANPGETVALDVELYNNGTGGVTGASAVLVSPEAGVAVDVASAGFGNISSGASAWGDAPFELTLSDDVVGGTVVPLELIATDGAETWTSLVELTVYGPAAVAERIDISAPGSDLDPGETGTLRVVLENIGNLTANSVNGVLTTDSQWVTITDANGTYGSVAPGSSVGNDSDLYGVSVAGDCYPGHLANFNLSLTFDSGATAQIEFQLVVGEAASTDPVGADSYGYYAFDDTDTAYDEAPTYAWVEIDPDYGGSGTSLGLYDGSGLNGDTETVDLPFDFSYYGQSFDKISVCSNGWLAMGATYLVHFRNWTIPSPGAPDNLVAVFWDNLYLSSGSDVLTYHDAANHRFIVEWSRLNNNSGGSTETFQAILYDPAYTAGDSGDGLIVCQYNDISNTDSTNGYATVGIQNAARDDGLLYTYWNQYAGGAATLTDGRAIAFRTVLPQVQGLLSGTVTNTTGGGSAVEGATISVVGAGRSLTTATDGSYLGGIPIGVYDVAVSHPSFAPDTTFGVTISEGLETVVDFALDDIAGPVFDVVTAPANTTDTSGPYTIEVEITDETGLATYNGYYTSSASGGPFALTLTATGTPDVWQAQIPGQPAGTRLQYWFTGTDIADNTGQAPETAPYAPYGFVVVDTIAEIYTSDMETDNGWTSGAADDDASTGLWVRVDPNAIIEDSAEVQPEDDHTVSGTMCWVTGNAAAGSGQGTEDVDGGRTTLLSPVFDVSDYIGLEVSYYRWYTNDTGNSPGLDTWLVQFSTDGGAWVDLENTMASDRSWQLMSFQLESYAAIGGTVQFRFIAADEGLGSVVEAAVDDFSLQGYQLPGDAADPTVSLTSFNGGQEVAAAEEMTITWDHADDIGVVNVSILLSEDGGSTWPHAVASGPLSSPQTWTPSGIQSGNCLLRITVGDGAGHTGVTQSAAVFSIGLVSAVGDLPQNRLALGQNAPNPFNPATEISFSLPRAQEIELRIYDLEGRVVRTLVDGRVESGIHTVTWRGGDDQGARVASGLYFYRLVTADGTMTKKMTLLK